MRMAGGRSEAAQKSSRPTRIGATTSSSISISMEITVRGGAPAHQTGWTALIAGLIQFFTATEHGDHALSLRDNFYVKMRDRLRT